MGKKFGLISPIGKCYIIGDVMKANIFHCNNKLSNSEKTKYVIRSKDSVHMVRSMLIDSEWLAEPKKNVYDTRSSAM